MWLLGTTVARGLSLTAKAEETESVLSSVTGVDGSGRSSCIYLGRNKCVTLWCLWTGLRCCFPEKQNDSAAAGTSAFSFPTFTRDLLSCPYTLLQSTTKTNNTPQLQKCVITDNEDIKILNVSSDFQSFHTASLFSLGLYKGPA